MKQDLTKAVATAVQKLFDVEVTPELTRPDEQFGDFATNVAMQLAGRLHKSPREVAEALSTELVTLPDIAEVAVAGPGFLNVRLSDKALLAQLQVSIADISAGKHILLEYSCPNAFKELHTGHLYQTIAGDALGKLFEATGATVYRANFGGDVGLHVAKCLYGIVQKLGGEYPTKLPDVPLAKRAEWLSAAYVAGAKAYEDSDAAKETITDFNTRVYMFHTMDDHETGLAQIYWTCRDWSYTYFKEFYKSIEVAPFDKFYPESSTFEPGLATVKAHMGSVFEESDGAVVYRGEGAGLHTRVFITKKDLPTYETKDLGVIMLETKDFSYDKRILMTGNDQSEYMKVVFAALHAIDADLAAKQTHLPHGTVRFGSGQKMSSRLGNVTRAVDVLNTISEVVEGKNAAVKQQITLGAVKYSFLKHKLGGDIAFDIEESVSLEGNSGPYLQYAHARARSVAARAAEPPVRSAGEPQSSSGEDKADSSEATKTPGEGEDSQWLSARRPAEQAVLATRSRGAAERGEPLLSNGSLQPAERSLVRKLTEYHEIIQLAATEALPHYLCTYLYELAQNFNRFYEHNRVVGDERQELRLQLVAHYAGTLKNGLNLLGIDAPEQM